MPASYSLQAVGLAIEPTTLPAVPEIFSVLHPQDQQRAVRCLGPAPNCDSASHTVFALSNSCNDPGLIGILCHVPLSFGPGSSDGKVMGDGSGSIGF